ncbi:SRPBCC family protein [Dyadobacter psychrotolerans]|uniref:ATPase n=1 Tax=Dyadobacter psychrotolerans TaxID=2541721 RepID=A0A4R5DX62_9BACT|nr:SRPBCC family protein [Dyadobacter psychrotolerans]TDE17234.1 ATPase [Dyadobacter psychrotolerans]
MATNISTININAPIERVWAALTDPELVKKWQYGSVLTTDWQPGSEIRFRTEWEGQVFEQWGIVLEMVPFELIKYSLFAPRPGLEDKAENYFVMNYILSDSHGAVKLEIIQQDDRPGAVQEDPHGEENPILHGLKILLEV